MSGGGAAALSCPRDGTNGGDKQGARLVARTRNRAARRPAEATERRRAARKCAARGPPPPSAALGCPISHAMLADYAPNRRISSERPRSGRNIAFTYRTTGEARRAFPRARRSGSFAGVGAGGGPHFAAAFFRRCKMQELFSSHKKRRRKMCITV